MNPETQEAIYSNDSINISVDAEWFYKTIPLGMLRDILKNPKYSHLPDDAPHSKYTQILSVQMASKLFGGQMFTHPDKSSTLVDYGVQDFKTPFAVIDYLGCEWRPTPVDEDGNLKPSKKATFHITEFMFSAVTDIQAQFAKRDDYAEVFKLFTDNQEDVKLVKGRRTRIANGKGRTCKAHLLLPYQINLENRENGRMEWNNISLTIIDISAMQGIGSLLVYAKNVGIKMPDKEVYTKQEKGRMDEMLERDPQVFIDYSMGDVLTPEGIPLLEDIYDRSNDFYNKLAVSMGLEPRECWGLSVGKITAAMMTEFFSKNPKVEKVLTLVQDKLQIVDTAKSKGKKVKVRPLYKLFYLANKRAGVQGFANAGRFDCNKDLATYGAMVDGGRATANRPSIKTYHEGVLVDIDIAGCYANGLRVQSFAVGNPTIVAEPMNLGDFLKKYEHRVLPGLWCARINWDLAPFGQDLLVSKVPHKWINWENGDVLDDDEDGLVIYTDVEAKIYDASMVVTTHSVYQAIINHDLLQLLRKAPNGRVKEGGFSSPSEWKWLLDNATITSFAGYLKDDEVEEVTEEMFNETIYSSDKNNEKVCKSWVRIPMDDWISPLIAERKKYQKKTPMNTFLKLICNATYGVIASSFFSGEGYGISDMVVGNNITARARALAWMMEKSLKCLNIATDGGVFDVNECILWERRSLDAANNVSYDNPWDSNGNRTYRLEPLYGQYVDTIPNLLTFNQDAWEFLKKTFPTIDICRYDQYNFESKIVAGSITFHSKSDYLLQGVIEYNESTGEVKGSADDVVRLRGLRGHKTNEQSAIMGAAKEFKGVRFYVEDEAILSLKDHHKGLSTCETTHLLPGDTMIKRQNWYSVTPLAIKWYNIEHYDLVMKMYDTLRDKQVPDAEAIKDLAKFDAKWYCKEYLDVK